jgi:hypothetical protein
MVREAAISVWSRKASPFFRNTGPRAQKTAAAQQYKTPARYTGIASLVALTVILLRISGLNAMIAYNITAENGRSKSVFFFKRMFREARLEKGKGGKKQPAQARRNHVRRAAAREAYAGKGFT